MVEIGEQIAVQKLGCESPKTTAEKPGFTQTSPATSTNGPTGVSNDSGKGSASDMSHNGKVVRIFDCCVDPSFFHTLRKAPLFSYFLRGMCDFYGNT